MWKHWVLVVLGLLVIFVPYFGLPPEMGKALLVFSGVVVVALSFWSLSEARRDNAI